MHLSQNITGVNEPVDASRVAASDLFGTVDELVTQAGMLCERSTIFG
jgi:hypothetical protein